MQEKQQKIEWLWICLLSVIIGGIVGVVDTFFGRVLLFLTDFRQAHFLLLIPFLAPVGMLFTYFYLKYGKNSSQGMNLIFDVGQREQEQVPKRLTPFIIIGTWLTHLFGGSAGREGVAVQIGAAIAHQTARIFKSLEASQFIVIGMAAGFGGLFGTPLAATFFAIEVMVVGRLRYDVFLPSLLGAFVASFVSSHLGLEKFEVALQMPVEMSVGLFWKLLVLGVLFGLVGLLFSFGMKQAKAFFANWLTNPIVRIGVVGVALSLIFFLLGQGRYSGLGMNLITDSFQGGTIHSYDWLLKLVLTILTVSVGFQGGEVTPLFAIGATLGVLVAPFLGLPVLLVAALGYASVFGSATNTLLAPIFIGGEVFGFEYLPCFVIVCGLAFLCNGNVSIYGKQQKG